MGRIASSDRGDHLELRRNVDGDGTGFQIRRTPATLSLSPEQIALYDWVIDVILSVSGNDAVILAALKKNRYHVRQTARDVDVPHSSVQWAFSKLQPARNPATPRTRKGAEMPPEAP